MMGDRLPSDAKFLDALITVSQELHVTMSNDALVKLFAGVFEDLLPGRLVCIRLVNQEGTLELVYANGRLLPKDRGLFRVTCRSMEGLKLTDEESESIFSQGRIDNAEDYVPIFENGSTGFGYLLCDRKKFYGMINLEYDPTSGTFNQEADRQIVLPFVHHLVAALRNARLMSETVILKEYWEKLVDNANAPVVVVDREGKITLVNKTFESKLGLTREQMAGEEFMSFIPTDNRARLLPHIISAIRGEPSTNVEMRFPKADEEGFAHIAFNAAPIRTSFNEIEGVIFVGQDLTLVRDLQRQIIHTEKLATLGQVAAGVAHELNNPLTSITVYTNYLLKKLDGEIDESDYNKLDKILIGANRIQSFTKDLVTYARPSGDEPELLRIGQLIERSVSFCEHVIAACQAVVTIEIDDNLKDVLGIRGQLEQVFVNLITNACHALPADGGAVHISVNQKDDKYVQIVLKDTGGGISESHLQKVFEPFFTTKDVGEGTGLGLSIVRNILKNHDADIEVESELGKGTAFVIVMRSA